MGKRIMILVFFTAILSSCSKDDVKKGVDCFGESLLVELKHSADATNPKIINYSIQYSGEHTISSVKWTFGDGSAMGTGTSVSHTYSAAGTFEVKADVTLDNGSGSCTVSPKKNVTVN